MINRMYQAIKTPRCEFVPIRNLKYHVRIWGEPGPDKIPLVMVHGWMDVAASYQFVVDAFARDHYVIAPDWRGYGQTEVPATDNYWFPDYLADLDFLLDHYSPGAAVHLVGHSMGGNVSMLYSGVRPERVRRLVNLEGFGMARTQPSQAAARYGKWIDEIKAFHRGEINLMPYASSEDVAKRLMKTNKRLRLDKAQWLAMHWARPDDQGMWRILGDPAHRIINPKLYRVDEVLEIFKCITAPTLMVEASDESMTKWWNGKFTLEEVHERMKSVPHLQRTVVKDAGHMLHHDQPQVLAKLIEDFLQI